MADPARSAPSQRGTTDDATSLAFTHRQIMTIFGALMLGMFLAALDQTIVLTAVRTIADDLHGLSEQAWATTAFLITSTIATPLYGKLSDQYGRKPLFMAAIVLFLIGSLTCTFAQSMYQLAGFRALQGLGAGGLMSLALAIIADVVSPRQRARYQGYFLAVFGTSSVLGPVIGGFLAGQSTLLGIAGWRWVFLVNLPIGVFALTVIGKVLHLPHHRRDHRIDIPGALFLAVALVPLLIIAEQGRLWGWDSGRAWACYLIGAAGLVLFYLAERWAKDDALLPLALFRGATFNLSLTATLITGVGMFGGMAVVPLYFQIVKGASPTETGLLMLPLVVGIMTSSVLSGQLISRTGRYKIFPVVGSALMVIGLLLFHLIDADTPLWRTDLFMVVFGLGLGNCMQSLTLTTQNAVPASNMGVATASSTFFRQMGGTIGTAVFLSILFSTTGQKIGEAFGRIAPTPQFQAALADPAVRANPANKPVLDLFASGARPGGNATGVLNDSSFLDKLDPRLARPFLVGFADSMGVVFLTAAVVVVLAFVVLLAMKEIPLRSMSGLQEQHAERGRAASAAAAAGPPVQPELQPEPAGALVATLVEADAADGRDAVARRAVRGTARRSDGSPLAGAAVTLIDGDGRQLERSVTGGDGGYDLKVPADAEAVLVVAAGGLQPQAVPVPVDGRPVDLDVVLSGTGALHGVATGGTDGRPVPGVGVSLVDGDGNVAAVTTTGYDGGYAFGEIPLGDYTVIATGDRPAAHRVRLTGDPEQRHDIRLGHS